MKKILLAAALMGWMLTGCTGNGQTKTDNNMTTLQLTQEWDKTFPKSRLAGTLFCGDVNDAREIHGNPKLDEAFELGKKV